MSESDWTAAFPLNQAQDAADVVFDAWRELSSRYLPHFNRQTSEPKLTKIIAARATALGADRRVQGAWLPEVVIPVLDETGTKIAEERRTDILYVWNNDHLTIQIIFEFKLLKRGFATVYIGPKGMDRFVTGAYSKGQPIALMVGMVLNDRLDAVNRISDALRGAASKLCMVPQADGTYFSRPSIISPELAEFDTVHTRPAHLAPAHGTITVSHVLLNFGYIEE